MVIFFASAGKDFTVLQFAKTSRTASIAANCETLMLVGTSLSAADKKWIPWAILSSDVTWACVRYSWKYSALSIIINDLVLLSIAWIQR